MQKIKGSHIWMWSIQRNPDSWTRQKTLWTIWELFEINFMLLPIFTPTCQRVKIFRSTTLKQPFSDKLFLSNTNLSPIWYLSVGNKKYFKAFDWSFSVKAALSLVRFICFTISFYHSVLCSFSSWGERVNKQITD